MNNENLIEYMAQFIREHDVPSLIELVIQAIKKTAGDKK